MTGRNTLLETLDQLIEATRAEEVTLGDLVAALGARGFGPLFMLLALLVMLPSGAIPGMPALVGGLLILLAGQLMLGWDTPWLPRRVKSVRIARRRIRRALDWTRPKAARLGRALQPRLEFLATGPVALRAAAAAVILAGLILIPLGFIPLLPFFLGLPVLAIGLGLMARDGVFTGLGFAAFLPVLWILVRQLG